MKEMPLIMSIIWDLFQKLRRRGFAIGIDDYEALQQSLYAGFGWSSRQAFLDLCNSLWAKSLQEQEILTSLFQQIVPDDDLWVYSIPEESTPQLPSQLISLSTSISNDSQQKESQSSENLDSTTEEKDNETSTFIPKTELRSGLPPINIEDVSLSKRSFVFVPQFPLTYREVAQTWRRLKQPIRMGAATELDIEATIARRGQQGIVTSVVLHPRRRNISRLLLLVDRQGSMAPFHRFCDEVCRAIQEAGRLEETTIYYFHNVPAEGADDLVLEPLSGQLFPTLDPILQEIKPLKDGHIYTDRNLLSPISLLKVLENHAVGSSVVVLSDAGAARRQYLVRRLLDTIAFMKALHTYSPTYVWLNPLPKEYWRKNTAWLNPLPKEYWRNNTASQIARHIPMFPLDREGMEQAVNVLRGHQYIIDKSI
jgi:uncharacterized protein